MYHLLDGVRVVEVSTWLFLPAAGAVLADWGADVIKVEDLESADPARGLMIGGQRSQLQPMVEFANRGKRSIALDVRQDKGLEVLYKLVAGADVFITNLRTKATERLLIDIDHLRQQNPGLICVRGTGYGQRGPLIDRAAFDLSAAWAAGGAAYAATRPDRDDPAFQPGSFGDVTGGLAAAGAVAAAIVKRDRTGEPSTIDVALQAVGMWMMGTQVTMAALGVDYPTHRQEAPINPLTNAFKTRDGRWLYFTILQADRFWPSFCAHIRRPDLVDDPRFENSQARAEHTRHLTEILNQEFAKHTLDEWSIRLSTFDGVWAPAKAPSELIGDPVARENGFIVDIDYPDGPCPIVASPAQFEGQPLTSLHRAPKHGEHTEEILEELGMSGQEIMRYRIDGAVL